MIEQSPIVNIILSFRSNTCAHNVYIQYSHRFITTMSFDHFEFGTQCAAVAKIAIIKTSSTEIDQQKKNVVIRWHLLHKLETKFIYFILIDGFVRGYVTDVMLTVHHQHNIGIDRLSRRFGGAIKVDHL